MKYETSRTPHLLDKFDTLREAFVELNSEAADFQHTLRLNDRVSRTQYDALARTLAFCDQMHLVLTLMREDLRSLEPHPAPLETAGWTDQLDECIDEWLRTACETNLTVH